MLFVYVAGFSFAYVTLGLLGFRIGRTKHEELFGLIGLKPRAAGKPEKVFVVDTSARFSTVAVNALGETCMATPAIHDGMILLRTRNRLIALSQGAKSAGRSASSESCP